MRSWCFLLLALVLSPASAQTIWGTKARAGQPPDLSQPPTLLFHYDPWTEAHAIVDTVRLNGIEIDMDGLAYTPAQGLVGFEHGTGGSRMIVLDTGTAVAQPLGPWLAGLEVCGACWDHGNDLLALDRNTDALLRIRGSDGTLMSSVPLTLNGAPFSLTSGDLDLLAGQFYIHEYYKRYLLDTASGMMTTVFLETQVDTTDVLGNCQSNQYPPGIGGIAATPLVDIHTYIAVDGNCEDDLYRYEVVSPVSGVEVVNDVSPGFNSGNMDLATEVAGLSTAIPSGGPHRGSFRVYWIEDAGLLVEGLEGPLEGELVILDMEGRQLYRKRANGASRMTIALGLRAGLYVVAFGPSAPQPVRFVVP
ncbi:MAG: hypothetical protein IPN38_04320 [Flavobacteriales bacterium]|nr:hypothetical protein [Flavobacteriales bacterium]